ncbi:MAG: SGNH/GDSL hydrolase family protein [Bacteroidota bacterium]
MPRFLALGDSYTIGEGVPEADRWPNQLVRRLGAEGIRLGAAEVVAVTGWTTADLAAGVEAAAPEGPFDLVTLLIGVNDQYDGVGLGDYRLRVADLLNRAVAFAGGEPGRALAVSIPDWSVTPFAEARDRDEIARQIDAFNAAFRTEAEARGIRWVDITPLTRTKGRRVVDDGLHPNAEAYAAWVDLILPDARSALA